MSMCCVINYTKIKNFDNDIAPYGRSVKPRTAWLSVDRLTIFITQVLLLKIGSQL